MFVRFLAALAAFSYVFCATEPVLAGDCSSEATYKAAPGGTASEITFHNGSSEQRRVYWLDESGQRKLKTIVEAGQSQRQNAIAGHAWVVTDPAEKCLFVVTAASAPITAEIGSGQGGAAPAAQTQPQTATASPAPASAASIVAQLGLSGWYQLSPASKPGRALNNMENGKPEIERVKDEWDSGYWEIADAPGDPGYIVITNKWTRKNLAAGNDGLHTVVGAARGQGAQWTLESADAGRFVRIKSRFMNRYLSASANGFEFIDQPGSGNAGLWQLVRSSQAVTVDEAAEVRKPKRASKDGDDEKPKKKNRDCPRGERFDSDRLDCVSIKCGRHQVYSKSEGQCIDKSDTCSRNQVYSSSMQACVSKAVTCSNNQVYSSSVGACINKTQPQPKPQPVQPKPPKCAYKTDGAGNCLTPQFLSCQKAYGACMKACGKNAGKCEAACHTKYAGTCGD